MTKKTEENALATTDTMHGGGSLGRYEPEDLKSLCHFAKIVVDSNLAPASVKTWQDAMLIMKRGAELGLSTQMALENIFVIKGKTTMYADCAVGLIKGRGHRFEVVESTDDKAVVRTIRTGYVDNGDTYSSGRPFEYSMAMAKRAGWTSNKMYQTIPRNMLLARAKMELARMVYEDLLAGVYDPTELMKPETTTVEVVKQVAEHYGAPSEDVETVEAEFVEEPTKQDDGWKKANARFWAVANAEVEKETAEQLHAAMKAMLGVESTKDLDPQAIHKFLDRLEKADKASEAIDAMIALWLHEDGTPRTREEVDAVKAADAEDTGKTPDATEEADVGF